MAVIVVGYVPKPEGEAALRLAVEEAKLRGASLVVVNSHRGRDLGDVESVRTDAFLDTVAVANGVSRVAGRTVRGIANGVTETLGLPSRRQVEGLQRSLDELNQKEKS